MLNVIEKKKSKGKKSDILNRVVCEGKGSKDIQYLDEIKTEKTARGKCGKDYIQEVKERKSKS